MILIETRKYKAYSRSVRIAFIIHLRGGYTTQLQHESKERNIKMYCN